MSTVPHGFQSGAERRVRLAHLGANERIRISIVEQRAELYEAAQQRFNTLSITGSSA
jgi:hypothetical protein